KTGIHNREVESGLIQQFLQGGGIGIGLADAFTGREAVAERNNSRGRCGVGSAHADRRNAQKREGGPSEEHEISYQTHSQFLASSLESLLKERSEERRV